mmetsp:Transcript_33246/g.61224  ORF Transcript_33246/g.61224 Transcript_33246/m.61224 type:complete len:257 (+) Transcript_33246:665-1435(+)
MRAVVPVEEAARTSADPASSSARTMQADPFWAASMRGVMPRFSVDGTCRWLLRCVSADRSPRECVSPSLLPAAKEDEELPVFALPALRLISFKALSTLPSLIAMSRSWFVSSCLDNGDRPALPFLPPLLPPPPLFDLPSTVPVLDQPADSRFEPPAPSFSKLSSSASAAAAAAMPASPAFSATLLAPAPAEVTAEEERGSSAMTLAVAKAVPEVEDKGLPADKSSLVSSSSLSLLLPFSTRAGADKWRSRWPIRWG